jgi:DNA polymerase-3 subunit epsilon
MHSNSSFVAIDFETADNGADSACAIGLVKVVGSRVVKRAYHLIRPPRREFVFSYLHGIEWRQVSQKPTFKQVWPELIGLFSGTEFIAAHNASFDRRVLYACCEAAGIEQPAQSFVCTVALARRVWKIYPTKLPDVCDRLGIRLDHHHALSDALACAKIVIASFKLDNNKILGRTRLKH